MYGIFDQIIGCKQSIDRGKNNEYNRVKFMEAENIEAEDSLFYEENIFIYF